MSYGDPQTQQFTRTCILVMEGDATIEKVTMSVNAISDEEVMVKATRVVNL